MRGLGGSAQWACVTRGISEATIQRLSARRSAGIRTHLSFWLWPGRKQCEYCEPPSPDWRHGRRLRPWHASPPL